jgi:hypothetical protein
MKDGAKIKHRALCVLSSDGPDKKTMEPWLANRIHGTPKAIIKNY